MLGDALGYAGRDCAKLWRDADGAVLAVRENPSLLHEAIPPDLWPGVLERAGWASDAELADVHQDFTISRGRLTLFFGRRPGRAAVPASLFWELLRWR